MSTTIRCICGGDIGVGKGPDTMVRMDTVHHSGLTINLMLTPDEALQLAAALETQAGGPRMNADKGKGL